MSIADKSLKSVLSRVSAHRDSAAQMLVAQIFSLVDPVQIIIAGDEKSEDIRSMVQAAHFPYIPGKTVMRVENDADRDKLTRRLPFVASVKPVDGRATAYVCNGRSCKPPVTDPSALAELLH